jgi:peptidoglycan/LPS O-acetylase OafA/YrhL
MSEAIPNGASRDRNIAAGFIPELESLRGIAALIVVIDHCFNILPHAYPPQFAAQPLLLWFAADLVGQGIISVMFFFALSGLVLGTQLSGSPVDSVTSYLRYAARRLLRLAPAMWASLLLALFVIYLRGQAGNLSSFDVLKNFVFASSSVNDVLWSMRVEIIVSLFFPLLYLAFLRSGPLLRIVTLLVLATIYLQTPGGTGEQSLRLTVWFYVGLMAGANAHHFSGLGRLERRVGVLAILCCYFGKNLVLWGDLGPMVAVYLILALSVAAAGTRETGWLRSKPLLFLGRISYSLYLLHMPVKKVVFSVVDVHALGMKFSEENGFIAQALVFVGTLAVTVPLAYLSWRYIELPFVRLGRRLSPVRGKSPPEPQESLAPARR